MKRVLAVLVLGAAISRAGSAAPEPEPAPKPVAAPADTSLRFVIQAGNRLYPDWHEDRVVRLGEQFFLGDTPFTGKVKEFFPDFGIQDGKALNWSLALNNPAIRVFVYADTGAVDSSWAFQKFPPHFSTNSFFTFQLKDVQGYKEPSSEPEPPKALKKGK